jgi:hypothetical protein
MCAITAQEGFGGFPWTTNTTFPGRKDPNELTSSAEGIVESDGTVPQCEVTVQLSTPYNTTGGLVATVLNLIFTNWCACGLFGCVPGRCLTVQPCCSIRVGMHLHGASKSSMYDCTTAPVTLLFPAAAGTRQMLCRHGR